MNTKIFRSLVILLFISMLISCRSKKERPMSSESIEKKFASGVVLIQNSYYYVIEFKGGGNVYFSGIDEKGDIQGLTFNPEEVQPVTAYGTGFFISETGMIATNSHVASPMEDVASVRQSIVNAMLSMANEWSHELDEINTQLATINIAALSADSPYESQEYQQMYNELSSRRDSMREAVNMANAVAGMEYEASIQSVIGIAYNDTHITNSSDFHDCVLIANDPEHDLAIIQLKDKSTPQGKYVFKVGKNSDSSEKGSKRRKRDKSDSSSSKVNVGTKLYMIGFNLGPNLGLTKEGLKAQVTSGEVSQDRDEASIMYSIPALHGSSGSPVVNSYGRLVAINFAGIDSTQSYNFGIKVKYLELLLQSLS